MENYNGKYNIKEIYKSNLFLIYYCLIVFLEYRESFKRVELIHQALI